MTYIHIGATAAGGLTPCYSEEAWTKLLAAMARDDAEAVIAITTGTRPTMIPTASLKPVERPSMADAAAAFWTKRGQTPKARAIDASGTPIVARVRT